jgi:hypothetical protein
MPFQSEKQRRYLHANHPEIAKRWEKEYAHGGILDITGDEEITTDHGNDIELTAFNAAFDDPNDLSTGVKTLFRAKDGGTPQLAKKSKDGTRPGYRGSDWGPGAGSPGTTSSGGNKNTGNQGSDHSHSRFEPGSGYYGETVSQPSQPQSVPSGINIHADTGDEEEAYVMVGGQKLHESKWGTSLDPREKYDTEEEMLNAIYGTTRKGINAKHVYLTNRTKSAYELALRNQKERMKSMGKGKLVPAFLAFVLSGFNPGAAVKSFSLSQKDLFNIVKDSIPVMQAKKAHMEALQNAKTALLTDVDITNPNEMVDLEETTDFTKIMNEIKDLTPKPEDDDDTGGDGPELPAVVPVHQEIEGYEGTYAMSPWDRIKANQAKRAMLVEKDIIQENPIVDESVTDITMQANSGGLANLFRVKNQ